MVRAFLPDRRTRRRTTASGRTLMLHEVLISMIPNRSGDGNVAASKGIA